VVRPGKVVSLAPDGNQQNLLITTPPDGQKENQKRKRQKKDKKTLPQMSNKKRKEKNKNKCPIDAHCHRHCRRDPRITKDCIGVRTQQRTSLGLLPHMKPYSLKISSGSLPASWCFGSSLRSC